MDWQHWDNSLISYYIWINQIMKVDAVGWPNDFIMRSMSQVAVTSFLIDFKLNWFDQPGWRIINRIAAIGSTDLISWSISFIIGSIGFIRLYGVQCQVAVRLYLSVQWSHQQPIQSNFIESIGQDGKWSFMLRRSAALWWSDYEVVWCMLVQIFYHLIHQNNHIGNSVSIVLQRLTAPSSFLDRSDKVVWCTVPAGQPNLLSDHAIKMIASNCHNFPSDRFALNWFHWPG